MTRYDDMMQKMTIEEMTSLIAQGLQSCTRWLKEEHKDDQL